MTHVLIVKKRKLNWNQERENNFIWSVENVYSNSLFSSCLVQPGEQVTQWAGNDYMTSPAWAIVQSQRYNVLINPVELYWIEIINKCFNMGSVTFHSLCIVLCTKTLFITSNFFRKNYVLKYDHKVKLHWFQNNGIDSSIADYENTVNRRVEDK